MRRHLKYILIMFIIPLVTSCIMDYGECEPSLGTKDNPLSIHFRMSMDDSSSSMTRVATWDDPYTGITGNSFDVQIDVSTVRVSVFEGETFKGAVSELVCYKSGNTYEFYGEISNIEFEASKDYKFMVFANCDEVDDANGEYDDLEFNVADVQLNNNRNKYIPMWGVTEFKLTQSGTAGNDQYLYDLGTIYMLRSVAKVQVFLGQGVTDFTIKSVTIRNHGASGYSLPLSWNKVANTKNLSWKAENEDAHSFNPKSGIATTGLNLSAEVEGSKYVVYLPEQENDGSVVMDVVVEDNDGGEYTFENAIYLKDYTVTGQPILDLVRNHYYEYTITKVNTGSSLELTCKVQPWTLVEESWDYTDLPAVSDDGHITWSDGNRQGNLVYFDASNPYATFTFGLSAPASATWRAEFVNKKGKQNAFRFTKVVNGAEVDNDANNPNYYMTGNVGEKVTLRVRYTNPNITEDNEAYLRILVILSDGRIIQVSELLDEHVITEGGQTTTIKGQEYIMVQTP